jgi:hypothetical protein
VNNHHGGGTARISELYQAVPNSGRSQQNKRPTELAPSIYLAASKCTLEEILKVLFRVHFPDCKLTHGSDGSQGELNLGVTKHITNRGDWNLAK